MDVRNETQHVNRTSGENVMRFVGFKKYFYNWQQAGQALQELWQEDYAWYAKLFVTIIMVPIMIGCCTIGLAPDRSADFE